MFTILHEMVVKAHMIANKLIVNMTRSFLKAISEEVCGSASFLGSEPLIKTLSTAFCSKAALFS